MVKKVLNLFSKYRSQIIVGVVVFLITEALGKLWSFIQSETPVVGSKIIKTLVDYVYYSAGQLTSEELIVSLLSIVLVTTAMLLLAMSFSLYRRIRNEINDDEKESNKIQLDKLSDKELQKLIKENEERIEELKMKYKKNQRSRKKSSVFAMGLSVFMLLYFIAFFYYPASLMTKFHRDITLITPYISEQEKNQLESDWIQMRGKTDYNNIIRIIESKKTVLD